MTETHALSEMLKHLSPNLHHGVYVFASVPHGTNIGNLHPIATFREPEGLTVILEESRAIEFGIPVLFRAAWITLEIQSDLAAVGLTAAVSSALAAENIACNFVAAAFHDHLFVPLEEGSRALEVLHVLSTKAKS